MRTRGVIKSSTPGEPLLSVITVVYNGALHIERAIESVLVQDYPNIEYIIIDGCSSDGTVEKIKKYENKIDYWVSEPDNGIYDAMNKGIAISRGELIGLLNSDDYYEPHSIKDVVAAYRDTACQGIYFGNSYVIQEDLDIRYLAIAKPTLWQGLGFKHQAMFIHRNIHERFGFYNTHYKIAADYDFVIKVVSNGVRLIYVNKSIVNYSNSGVSGNNRLGTLNEIRAIGVRHFGFFSFPHLRFLLVYSRSCLFQVAGQLIKWVFGGKRLLAIRAAYTRYKIN